VTLLEEAAPPGASRESVPQKRCVLIVHGVGEQRKSDTLLYIGSPLLAWVSRWAQQL